MTHGKISGLLVGRGAGEGGGQGGVGVAWLVHLINLCGHSSTRSTVRNLLEHFSGYYTVNCLILQVGLGVQML